MKSFSPHPFHILLPTSGKRPDLLTRTLQSLADCDQPPNFQQTIVIENGGDGSSESAVTPFTDRLNLRFLHQKQGNKSAALNTAMQSIGTGLIFFTDDDVRFAPNVLTAYAEAAATEQGGVYFGGPTSVDYEDAPPPKWLLPFLPYSAKGFEPSRFSYAMRVGHFQGYNWAAFAQDIHARGGFDPNHGPGSPTGATGQESDMQDRLRKAGLLWQYLPNARVWHWVPAKRCSPEWAIQRSYRSGVAVGLNAVQTGRLGTRWTGPLRSFVYLAYRWLLTRYAYMTGPPEQRHFLQQVFSTQLKGLREGYCNQSHTT